MKNYDEALKDSLEYFDDEELPATRFLNKYAIKTLDGEYEETTPDEMHHRLAKEFARIESKYPNSLSEEKIYNYFKDFKKIIPQGSPMAAIGNPYQVLSTSNCFVSGNQSDSYGGILEMDQNLVQLMKRRGGVGVDISHLRPEGSSVQNAARSSTGAVSFMHRFSNTTREVAQAGRRGALMITIDIRHPEAEKFVTIKSDLSQVTGANISLKLTDEFMRAVREDREFTHRFPIDAAPEDAEQVKKSNAKELWDKIVSSAHQSAEPGLLFWDKILSESPADCYSDLGFKTISTNPCVTGDTLLSLTNANCVSIKELAESDKKKVKIECVNPDTGEVELKWGRNPRKTGEDEQIYELLLEDGTALKATADHKIMTSDLEYTELQNLEKGQELYATSNFEIDKTHVVAEVNKLGREDVYNITVDDNHNYLVATKYLRGKSYSSICVKNCGEIPLPIGDSCRLLLLNYYGFVKKPFTEDAYFDWKEFKEAAHDGQRLMDDLVDIEIEQIDKIIAKIDSDPEPTEIKRTERRMWEVAREKAELGRRTGFGFTALGDCLAALGITYGSEKAVEFTNKITKIQKLNAYSSSIEMAKERGAFPIWDSDRETENPFLLRIADEDPELYEEMQRVGRRNIALGTTSPAGTCSLMARTSSGIENAFKIFYYRSTKVNPGDDGVEVDYYDDQGDAWMEYAVFHKKFKVWLKVQGYDPEEVRNWPEDDIAELVENSPYHNATMDSVDWLQKVNMQAAAQKNIDHSISCTTNLPEDVSVDKVKEIYMTAWEQGLKGQTIYREGSRTGVLNTESNKDKSNERDKFKDTHAPKRPDVLPCDVQIFQNNKEKWIAFIGIYQSRPYEIFTGKLDEFDIPPSVDHGAIVKERDDEGNSRYDFHYEYYGESQTKEGLDRVFDPEYWNYAKLVSGVLRHGMPLPHVVDVLQDLELNDLINSWKAGVIRRLKKYISDGQEVRAKEQMCDDEDKDCNLIYTDGCVMCETCGKSRC